MARTKYVAKRSSRPPSLNPFGPQELLREVIRHLDEPKDVFACTQVNSVFSGFAIERLYEGSDVNQKFRSPPIEAINRLMGVSRARYEFNFSWIKHLRIDSHTQLFPWDDFFLSGESYDGSDLACTTAHLMPLSRSLDIGRLFGAMKKKLHGIPLQSLTIFCGLLNHFNRASVAQLLNFEVVRLRMDLAVFQRMMAHVKVTDIVSLALPSNLPGSLHYHTDSFMKPRLVNSLQHLELYASRTYDKNMEEVKELLRHVKLSTLRVEFAKPLAGGSLVDNSVHLEAIWCLHEALAAQSSNLRGLALVSTGSFCPCPENRLSYLKPYPQSSPAWPNMRVLVYNYPTSGQLINLTRSSELEMLRCVGEAWGTTYSLSKYHFSLATHLPNTLLHLKSLRILHLQDGRLTVQELLQIARSARQLESFSNISKSRISHRNHTCSANDLLAFLKLLPNARLLALDYCISLTSTFFMSLPAANHALPFLSLPRAQAVLSLQNLQRMPPLPQLRLLDLQGLFFAEQPIADERGAQKYLACLTPAWRRVFPHLTFQPVLERSLGASSTEAEAEEKRLWGTVFDAEVFATNAHAPPKPAACNGAWLCDKLAKHEADTMAQMRIKAAQLPHYGYELRRLLWKACGYKAHEGGVAETYWAWQEAKVLGCALTRVTEAEVRLRR